MVVVAVDEGVFLVVEVLVVLAEVCRSLLRAVSSEARVLQGQVSQTYRPAALTMIS